MDLSALHDMLKVSPGKSTLAARVTPSSPEVEDVHVKAVLRTTPASTPKRSAKKSMPRQEDPTQTHKRVKVAVRKHKSRHGEGSSRLLSKDKRLIASSKEPVLPAHRRSNISLGRSSGSVEIREGGSASPTGKGAIYADVCGAHVIDDKANCISKACLRLLILVSFLKWSNHLGVAALFTGSPLSDGFTGQSPLCGSTHNHHGSPSHQSPAGDRRAEVRWWSRVGDRIRVVGNHAEQWASDLQADKKLMAQLLEATNRLELSDQDLNDIRADLSEAQRELKEQWAGHRKVDDDLLKAIRELETQRTELPKKIIEYYKESVGFRWGL
ncbi:hypothetical protein BHM03_00013518 [Ensete ventricosum]|nr:hypothetical protein BHM03_00013518 [Ensete ventricosum]